ncbi:MAG: hypothetical protein RBR14_01395 [Candidatus Cloacimonas acidaminovorans]|nr:hypothetical protein [Candidatus Cloacimonas acidaminovorans]
MKKTLLTVIALVAVLGVAQAAPFQTLGMLRTPDAYVLPNKAAEFLVVGYYRDISAPKPRTEDAKDASKGFFPYTMIGVGILDRVELSMFLGDYTSLDGLVYLLNAKVKIIEETLLIPQIAVGMDNILSPVEKHGAQYLDVNNDFADNPEADSYEPYSPYAVASKQVVFWGIPWMFNLGIGSNRFVGQAPRARYLTGTFFSVEMSPVRDLTLQGEFDGEDINIGINYAYKNFGFKLGASAIEDRFKDSDYKNNIRVALGISYLFDKYAEAKRRPDLGLYASYGKKPSAGGEVVEVGETPIETGVVVPPTSTTVSPTGEIVVVPPTGTAAKPPAGGEVVVGPGTQLQTPGLVTPGTAGYQQLSPEVQDLLKELQMLKEERQKAQQAMEELRKWIEELKKKQ